MAKQKGIFLSLIICIILIVCCCCGSPAKDSETAYSGEDSADAPSATSTGARTERYDKDNGDYTILQYDENDYLIQQSSYTADGTLQSDTVYEPSENRRVVEAYRLSYEQKYGSKIEQWYTYLYTPESPLVKVQWKEIEYITDNTAHSPGEYTGTAEIEYQMQDPGNRIDYSTVISKFDKEQFLIVPEQYRVTEYDINNTKVASSGQLKFEEAKTADNSDAQMKDGDRLVLTGTVQMISYDEAVELQGYPDYNAADTGQTWVIVRLDSPQLLKGTQDVSTWEREYAVVLVWTRRSSGMESGETTLSDYIGKHITFSAGSFSMASDTSVPIGVPWAHDIHVLEVTD